MSAHPILYSFRRCPYAMRARLALNAAGIPCELREVVLRNKPVEMLEASPKGTVPVLVLPDGKVIDESLSIMEWALSRHDPEGWTDLPREDWREVVQTIDGPFKHNLDRYKYPNRYEGVDGREHRKHGLEILERMNSTIRSRGHLAGRSESLADMAAFPFVRQFANTDRAWFDRLELPALQDWLARHLESHRFAQIMEKHAAWSGGDGPLVFQARSDHKAQLIFQTCPET